MRINFSLLCLDIYSSAMQDSEGFGYLIEGNSSPINSSNADLMHIINDASTSPASPLSIVYRTLYLYMSSRRQ